MVTIAIIWTLVDSHVSTVLLIRVKVLSSCRGCRLAWITAVNDDITEFSQLLYTHHIVYKQHAVYYTCTKQHCLLSVFRIHNGLDI